MRTGRKTERKESYPMFDVAGLITGVVILVVWIATQAWLDWLFTYTDNTTGKKVKGLWM